jgi:hypothetical protein
MARSDDRDEWPIETKEAPVHITRTTSGLFELGDRPINRNIQILWIRAQEAKAETQNRKEAKGKRVGTMDLERELE